MTTESIIKSSGVNLDPRTEQAAQAVKVFRQLQPGLTGYARAITGNRRTEVVLDSGTPRTDGAKIYYRPPIELGDRRPHRRKVCDRRDPITKQQVCDACRVREEVMIVILHEIAHQAYGTFAEVSDYHLRQSLTQAVTERGTKWSQAIKERLQNNPPSDYLNLANMISEYLPVLVNGLEDARVNSSMFRARAGTQVMMEAFIYKLFAEGMDQADGSVEWWKDQGLDAQALIAMFLLASGYTYQPGWLCEEIEQRVVTDDQIRSLTSRVPTIRSAAGIFELSFPILARIRELGYCRLPDDPDDGQPEPQDEEQDDDSSEQSEQDESEDSAGDPEEDDSNDSDDDQSESSDSSELEDEDGLGSTGEGAPEGDDQSESSDSGGGDEEPGEDEAGEGSDSSTDSDGDDGADEGSDESESDQSGEAAPGGDAGAAPSDEEASEDGAELTDEDSTDGGSDSQESGHDGTDDRSERGEDSTGGDESGNGADEDGPASEVDSGRMDDQPGDGPTGEAGTDDAGVESAEEAVDSSEEGADEVDSEEVLDTGADEGKGGRESNADLKNMGPDEVKRVIEIFSTHDPERSPLESGAQSAAEQSANEEAITVAVIQGEYFEQPSTNVNTVEVFRNGVGPGWRRIKMNRTRLGVDGDWSISETVLGRALLETRRVLADNKRASYQHNLRSGKVRTRSLGKKAWSGDDRLMQKRRIPGKRDYAVLIGVDVSGSTAGENIKLAKRAALAQAELCQRVGIAFAVYAHTADSNFGSSYGAGLDMQIMVIKDFNEPWDTQRQTLLTGLNSCSYNLDGHTLEFYRKRLDERPETDKILLYYTDGKMPAANYTEELYILQREIQVCKKKGYILLGVGIRTDSPVRHGLDTVRVDSDDDLVGVVKHLEKRLVAVR